MNEELPRMRTTVFWALLFFLGAACLVVLGLPPLQATYVGYDPFRLRGVSLMEPDQWERAGGILSKKFAGTSVDWIDGTETVWTLPGHEASRDLVEHRGQLLENHQQYSARTKQEWGSFQMTLEFRFEPDETGLETKPEDFGNSGVYIFGLYEIQLLDTSRFVDPGPLPPGIARDGNMQVKYRGKWLSGGANRCLCGSVYGGGRHDQVRPMLGATTDASGRPFNYCRPTGEWNRMVIYFTPPRFDGKTKTHHATIAAEFNGRPVYFNGQSKFAITGPTGSQWKKPDRSRGPIVLQDHFGKVAFRNMAVDPLWTPPSDFAVMVEPSAGQLAGF